MKLSVVRPTPGALVVLLGTSSNGDGSSVGVVVAGKAGDGRRLLSAACKLPKKMTHSERLLGGIFLLMQSNRVSETRLWWLFERVRSFGLARSSRRWAASAWQKTRHSPNVSLFDPEPGC